MAATRHNLGFANGTMVDDGQGTLAYIKFGAFTQALRVRVADVTGFSVSKGGKVLERTIHIYGNGAELGAVSVAHGVSEKIEAFIRAHPHFGWNAAQAAQAAAPPQPAPSAAMIADELRKLADLRAEGILNDEEFAQQKRRLLGS